MDYIGVGFLGNSSTVFGGYLLWGDGRHELELGRHDFFFFHAMLYFFPYSRISAYLLREYLGKHSCLSLVLHLVSAVSPYCMVLSFFRLHVYKIRSNNVSTKLN